MPARLSILTLALSAGLARAQVVDDSFETSGPLYPAPAPWTQSSTNFGTPLCDGSCFGPGEPTAARTGQWWAWFGGTDTAVELGRLTQSVPFPPGQLTLRFYLNADSDRFDGSDTLKVYIDGNLMFSIADFQLAPYAATYIPVAIDVSAFAGVTRTLEFTSLTNGGGFLTNFFIDDVSLIAGVQSNCYPNCDNSTAVPMLTGNDFVCFFNRFAAQDPYSNCDGSTAVPMLTGNDFVCFVNRFAAGCS